MGCVFHYVRGAQPRLVSGVSAHSSGGVARTIEIRDRRGWGSLCHVAEWYGWSECYDELVHSRKNTDQFPPILGHDKATDNRG